MRDLILPLIALAAAIASWVSATAARASADHAQSVYRQSLIHNAKIVANKVISVGLSIDGLGNDLKKQMRDLSTFSGRTGRGAITQVSEDIELKQNDISRIVEKAREFLDRREPANLSEDELG